MKRILLAAVVVVVAAGASSARASVCTRHPAGQLWYADIEKHGTTKAEHGAAINLETNTLASGYPDLVYVDHVMWYGVTANCRFYVVVGVTDGSSPTSGGARHHAVFWGDNRANGGGYHEHFPSLAWDLSAYYQVKVVWAGNNSWAVYFGGVHLGTSLRNYYGGTGRCLAAGIAANGDDAKMHVTGHMYGWARKARNDIWYQDWDGKSFFSYCPADIDVSSINETTETLHGPN
jgi:hypothetical protein